jgi:hypothetical protein
MKNEELESKNININKSLLKLLLRNYVDNQLILKLISEKFEIDLKDYTKYDKESMDEALDLLDVYESNE